LKRPKLAYRRQPKLKLEATEARFGSNRSLNIESKRSVNFVRKRRTQAVEYLRRAITLDIKYAVEQEAQRRSTAFSLQESFAENVEQTSLAAFVEETAGTGIIPRQLWQRQP